MKTIQVLLLIFTLFSSQSLLADSGSKKNGKTIINIYKSALLNLVDSKGCDIDQLRENAYIIERPGAVFVDQGYLSNATRNGMEVLLRTKDDMDIEEGEKHNITSSILISDSFNIGSVNAISYDGEQLLCIVRAYQKAMNNNINESLIIKGNNDVYINSIKSGKKKSFVNDGYINSISFSNCTDNNYCYVEFEIKPAK
ncbi:hypothetical protein KS573_002999 [Salmonella enterica]|nr:hypothetical protein [Salmonella enterica]EGL4358109.1 hypothetical protein [Salmonella enterica]EGL4380933.1 hypothetical protein [Salmonella enterica]EGL4487560.1 hypothetical protein [Salmonella enterica]EGL4512540.1 hypothetical protein [Salmonella enterica]